MGNQTEQQKPVIIADLLYVDEILEHVVSVPFVRASLLQLSHDFHKVYAEYLNQKILDDSDDSIASLRLAKTQIFQAFIGGNLNALDPDGQFKLFCDKNLKKEGPSRIITPP